MKVDIQATMKAGFLDKRSYVRMDGREVIHGEDWKPRREALLKRDGSRCQNCKVYVTIDRMHAHHVVPRGSAGVDRDDRLSNLTTLCWRCHHAEHVQVRWSKTIAER
jgi:5-methylcytosine-specific restriction endonuclease McrA